MLSAAWRSAAKVAVNKTAEARMTCLRHATACQANRVAALDE
jgi:hypothetical protein